ncbi:MAG: GtrA family protein [Campylobacterota bacterium]|nr:GtrA family protein [Campylobacterota bacterium]
MSQVTKFLFLGVLSTGVDYLMYSLLILLCIDYVIAIVVGYSAGLIVNYHIGRQYIFTSGTKLKNTHREFIAVVLIAIVGMLLNIAIVKVLSYSFWDIDPLYSRIAAIGFVFFWNYFLRKIFIYH